jgi:hypothetical protein
MLALLAPSSFAYETSFSGSACPDGVFLVGGKDNLPDGLKLPKSLWGTRCANADADTGTARSAPFQLKPRSVVYLSGYPLKKGLSVSLINLATGEVVRLTPKENPREAWARYDLPMRDKWAGANVALELKDELAGSGGWVGASAVDEIPFSTRQEMLILNVAGAYCLATLLVGAPLWAFFLLFRRLGASNLNAGLCATASLGTAAYATFWLGVASPAAPVIMIYALAAFALGVPIFTAIRRSNTPAPLQDIRPVLLIIAFVWAVGLFFLAAGHLYGPPIKPSVFESYFFETVRPYDDVIPLNFAKEIWDPQRNLATPDFAGWHYSDRGPLQTGFVLLAKPVMHLLGIDETYQALGTLLQIMSCVAVWAFARALGVGPRMSFLILATTAFTPLVYYNALYVWPKMLAGGFCLLSFALLFPALVRKEKLKLVPGLCAAVFAALAVLAHGGTIFAFAAAGLLMLPGLVRIYPLKVVAPMALVVIALMGSWSAYGTFVDRGEDRLTRLHFTGGVDEPDLSIGQRVLQSHLRRPPAAWVKDRVSNIATLFGEPTMDRQIAYQVTSLGKPGIAPPLSTSAIDSSKLSTGFDSLIAVLRVDQREYVFRSLAFAGIGLVLIIAAFVSRKPETQTLRKGLRLSFWFIVLTALFWSIAEFYGARTVVTHASFGHLYVIAVAALASAALVFRPLVAIFCVANIVLVLAVWILPGPGLFLRTQLDAAGVMPSLQYAAIAIMAPAALLAAALAFLNLRAQRQAMDPEIESAPA